MNLAAALLLVGVSRHYGWDLLGDPTARALASKALGAATILAVAWIAYRLQAVRSDR